MKRTILMSALVLAACATVEVKAPEKPIVIDLNVKIEHEIRIKVEKDLDKSVFAKDSPLF